MLSFIKKRTATALISALVLSACGGSDGLPTPTPTPTPTPVASAKWEILWSDEFDVDGAPDSTKWSFEVNCFGGGNNEQQCYTDRAKNTFVADGYLSLVASEEEFSGPNAFDDDPAYDPNDTSRTQPFTSGRVRTKDLFDFKYGRVEFRAQLPGGQGSWPALWMLPTDEEYGSWPRSGEIDVMEAVNLDVEGKANEIHGTLHYGLAWPQWTVSDTQYESDTADFTNEFHVYAIEWEENEIRWYIDGTHYQTQTADGWYNYILQGQEKGFDVASPTAPFDKDFHIIMNLAIGGDFPGDPDTGWTEDRKMLIDYVRVYQCSSNTTDGSGCKGLSDPIDDTIEVNTDAGAPLVNKTVLFDGSPKTLALNYNNTDFTNTLNIQAFQAEGSTVTITTPDIGGEYGQVMNVDFSGVSNMFLATEDLSAATDLDWGIQLNGGSGWSQAGELEFDLYIDSIAEGTELWVKMDSGYPNLGQIKIDLPELQTWTHVSISIAELIANPQASGSGLSIDKVLNPFVIEPVGDAPSASIQLDNISISCAVSAKPKPWQQDQVCDIQPAIDLNIETPNGQADIFIDTFSIWQLGVCCDGVVIEELEEEGRGNVIQFTYSTDTTVTFLQAPAPMDFSTYAGGTIEFDIFVESEPVDAVWVMKTETHFQSNTSGDVLLTDSIEGVAPPVGAWQHYTFNLDDLVSREGSNLDLSSLQTPLVIFPAWGNQNGAVFRIDNVIMKEALSAP